MNDEKIKGRIILAAQSTGRIGKSVTMESLSVFLDYVGAEYTITDADSEHHTISDRDPSARRAEFSEPDDLLRIIMRAGKKVPVELIDVPAQKTDYILNVFEQFNAFELARAASVKLTLLVFVADDPAAEASLAKILPVCGAEVDYVVIRNPARFKSRHYDGSPLQAMMKELDAPVIDIPTITQTTMDELTKANDKLGRWLPLSEAAKSDSVNQYSQHELQFFLNRMLAAWSGAARVILPDDFKFTPFVNTAKKKVEAGFKFKVHIPD